MRLRLQRRLRVLGPLLVLGCPLSAAAFCGFFVSGADAKLVNNASQVVLMRSGNRTVMTMSNNYKGPPEDFAMVVPVPVVLQKENVKVLPHDVFDHIDQLSAPRLVEYWEQDPCAPRYDEEKMARGGAVPVPRKAASAPAEEYGVKILAKFVVGEYQILILSAEESSGLEKWLRAHKYKIPSGAAEALAPYVRDQMKFFVAKVDIAKVQRDAQGLLVLSPLRFHFESNELRLPIRLGLLNAEAKQDLIVYVLSPSSRFEVANYRTVPIPTNLEVADEVRASFPGFYAELFDATISHYGGRAVVTEYAWDTGSCDPCPTPPLRPDELSTLGADVMGQREMARYGRFVLTRLHTRYDRQALSDDLIFRAAPALEGGREGVAETRTQPGGMNNFQARYIIRHYWSGPIKCQNPQWGIWGGPPGGAEPRPMAAQGLANAPRGKLALGKV
ncbi:MAG TPA: DUF2330 domain-containing protein, partial [Polyangia bacterium]|nr:DUF2330 domain-containing protein [Polyangia bacterium]